jgi:Fe-S-cluster containining protein
MSLRRERALLKLRKLRAQMQRSGLPPVFNVYHVAALTGALVERLSERGDPARASAAAEYLFRMATPSFSATGIEPKLACRRGCDYCCRGYVSATAPQVFAAARAVRAGAAAYDAARARVAAAAARVRHVDWLTRCRMHEPCPLLVDGACSIYAARPLACRGFVSYSVAECRQAFEDGTDAVQMPAPYANVRSALESALRAALKRVAYAHESYELDTALERVLERPDAEAAWLAGEDVFAGVDVDRSADPGTALQREIMLDTLIAVADGETPEHLLGGRPA